MDSGKVKVAVSAAVGALALYLLYKVISKGKATASIEGQGPFTGRIDPRAPVEVKQKEASDAVVDYINQTFKGQPLKANAFGLFDEKDFKELLMAMNFYAQSMLYDIKIQNQNRRYQILKTNLAKYVETMSEQQKNEVDTYTDAMNLICQTAKIGTEEFLNTYKNQASGKDQILNELFNQCMSPFKSQRGFTREQIIEIFSNVSGLTLSKLKDIESQFPDTEAQDYFIFFDKIITDFALQQHGVNCIEFWASVWKFNLFSEPYEPAVTKFLNDFVEFMQRHPDSANIE